MITRGGVLVASSCWWRVAEGVGTLKLLKSFSGSACGPEFRPTDGNLNPRADPLGHHAELLWVI